MKKRILKWISAFAIILIGAAIVLYEYLPYHNIAERKIKAAIEAQGIKVNSLKVEKITNSEAIISNIDLGNRPSITASNINVVYALQELVASRFYSNTNIKAQIDNININSKPYLINANKLTADVSGNNGTWSGKVNIPALHFSGAEQQIPALEVNSDFKVDKQNISANIFASDKNKLYDASLAVLTPYSTPKQGSLIVKHIEFPWGGGKIYADDITLPLAFDKPVKATIYLKDVLLADTLGKVSEGKISGDGKINGSLPITYFPDGKIILDKGLAEAGSSGTINVSPTLIPGDNSQVAVARTALENFHYTTLKISVSSDESERSSINLTVEGNNPEAFEGRPVKLNVNLTGDIIPLLQQSLLPINDIKKLMELKDTK